MKKKQRIITHWSRHCDLLTCFFCLFLGHRDERETWPPGLDSGIGTLRRHCLRHKTSWAAHRLADGARATQNTRQMTKPKWCTSTRYIEVTSSPTVHPSWIVTDLFLTTRLKTLLRKQTRVYLLNTSIIVVSWNVSAWPLEGFNTIFCFHFNFM